jgi:hypothetical protein
MTLVSTLRTNPTNLAVNPPSTSTLESQPAVDFDTLMNGLLQQNRPTVMGNATAIQVQESLEAFLQKLDLLSGMAQQAQIAMNSAQPLPDGISSPQAQTYYYAESLLAQVGLPGAVLAVV